MKIYWFTATNFGDQDVDNVENKVIYKDWFAARNFSFAEAIL